MYVTDFQLLPVLQLLTRSLLSDQLRNVVYFKQVTCCQGRGARRELIGQRIKVDITFSDSRGRAAKKLSQQNAYIYWTCHENKTMQLHCLC